MGTRLTSRRPTEAKLYRSIQEVEAAIVDKQDLIEDLSLRVKSIRLSTPSGRRSMGYAASGRPSVGPASKPVTFEIPKDVTAAVVRQLDLQDKPPKFTSKVARAPRVAKTATSINVGKLGLPGKIDISAFVREDAGTSSSPSEAKPEPLTPSDVSTPVPIADKRPSPGSSKTSERETTQVTPSISESAKPNTVPPAFSFSPAPGAGSPSPAAFGGIKLSLDPGDLSSSHTRSRTATAGTRAHHAAPRLGLAPQGDKGGSSPPASSFFPPPASASSTASPSADKGSPKGFFSFSGFGQQ